MDDCTRTAEVAVHGGVVTLMLCMSDGVRYAALSEGVAVQLLHTGMRLQLSGTRHRGPRGGRRGA